MFCLICLVPLKLGCKDPISKSGCKWQATTLQGTFRQQIMKFVLGVQSLVAFEQICVEFNFIQMLTKLNHLAGCNDFKENKQERKFVPVSGTVYYLLFHSKS